MSYPEVEHIIGGALIFIGVGGALNFHTAGARLFAGMMILIGAAAMVGGSE